MKARKRSRQSSSPNIPYISFSFWATFSPLYKEKKSQKKGYGLAPHTGAAEPHKKGAMPAPFIVHWVLEHHAEDDGEQEACHHECRHKEAHKANELVLHGRLHRRVEGGHIGLILGDGGLCLPGIELLGVVGALGVVLEHIVHQVLDLGIGDHAGGAFHAL